MRKIADSQNEAYRIQDVRFPSTIEPSDSIEFRIETFDLRSRTIRLEAIQNDAFNKHLNRVYQLNPVTILKKVNLGDTIQNRNGGIWVSDNRWRGANSNSTNI